MENSRIAHSDDEGALHQDFEEWLEHLAPEKPHSRYRHNSAEDNADAHLKHSIMGREVEEQSGKVLPVSPFALATPGIHALRL